MKASNPEPPKLLVDQRETARILSVSPGTIFNLTKSGELPCVRVGRSVRYSTADLAAWIASRRIGGTLGATPAVVNP